MLEIEKQQQRFPDRSLKEMTSDYDRNFVRAPRKEVEKSLPNSPYPAEGTGQLPLKPSVDKKTD